MIDTTKDQQAVPVLETFMLQTQDGGWLPARLYPSGPGFVLLTLTAPEDQVQVVDGVPRLPSHV